MRLPMSHIDVHQPLSDLGLDSLMATEFFAQIESTFDKNLPLATLIEAPSIEQLADLLDQVDQEDRDVSWSSLVEVQPGNSKPPVFFIHAEEGNILFYRDLSRHLGQDQPFYGLQARGLSGEEEIVARPIEEMAADYIEEIRTVQPHGPYFLGGFCMGAGLALEMAQQLQAQDEEVALLMMIQPLHLDYRRYPPRTTVAHRLVYRVMERVDYEVSKLSPLDTSEKLAYLRQRTERTATILEAKISMALEPLLDKTPWRIPHTKSYALEALSESHKEAYFSYEPAPYRGRVIIFRASKQPLGIYPDPTLGWGRLIDGETETFEIPAYHQTILEEPQARIVAEKLAPCLVSVNGRSAGA
jgi:thioesterase domain-containing protein/acyl carrier protein